MLYWIKLQTCSIFCCKDIRDNCPTNKMMDHSVLLEPATPLVAHGRSSVIVMVHLLQAFLQESVVIN